MGKTAFFCMMAAAVLLAVVYDFYAAFLTAASLMTAALLSAGTALLCRCLLHPRITVPDRAERGTPLSVMVDMGRPNFLFPWTFHVRAAGRELEKAVLSGRHAWRFSYPASHCGMIKKPDICMVWHDFFGLFQYSKRFPSSGMILVVPRLLTDSRSAVQCLKGLLPSSEDDYNGGSDLYHPGDDMRHINWKTSARYDELYLRRRSSSSSPYFLALTRPENPEDRVLAWDTWYTLGAALLASRHVFSIFSADASRHGQVFPVHDGLSFRAAMDILLKKQYAPSSDLSFSSVPDDACLLWVTGSPDASPRSRGDTIIWSTDESCRAASFAGRKALLDFWKGGSHE